MLFEYLKSITVTKNDKLSLEEYIPFLISRWLSFGVATSTQAINETVNSLGNIEKEYHFKLLLSLFPKFKYQPKFNYIKKVKQSATQENEKNKLLAQSMELSVREINELLKQVELKKQQDN